MADASAGSQYIVSQGQPWPQGASVTSTGCNFSLFASEAEQVFLCLYDRHQEIERIELNARSEGIWHIHLEGITPGQWYGYRVKNPSNETIGQVSNLNKLLIDPYAKALSHTLNWHNTFRWQGSYANSDSGVDIPKSIVTADDFDWQGDTSPTIDPAKRVVYELHVKGFTQLHEQVQACHRGKFLGLIEPAVIDYLKQLGVTTLQLLPCFSFMTEARLQQHDLVNYWGYNPYSYFTPDWRYAQEDPVAEFKAMVQGLHAAGFEVILDVVYNHTACLLYTSPSPRDKRQSRMPSSA